MTDTALILGTYFMNIIDHMGVAGGIMTIGTWIIGPGYAAKGVMIYNTVVRRSFLVKVTVQTVDCASAIMNYILNVLTN